MQPIMANNYNILESGENNGNSVLALRRKLAAKERIPFFERRSRLL
jgi:hypothetical protein